MAAVVEHLLDTGIDEETLIELGLAAIKERVYIPKTYAEAVNDPDSSERWKEAIDAKLTALQANQTWEIVTKLKDTNVVTSK